MLSEARLRRGMEPMLLRMPGKAAIDDRHEQLCEWWGNSNTTVVVHVGHIALTLI